MAKEIKIGEMYIQGAPDDAKVIDIGDQLEFDRICKEEEKQRPMSMAIGFVMFFIIIGAITLAITRSINTGAIAGAIAGLFVAIILKFSKCSLKKLKVWVELAKKYNGSYYFVETKTKRRSNNYAFYGKKDDYHIYSEKPRVVGSVPMGNRRASVYLNSFFITRFNKSKEEISGNKIILPPALLILWFNSRSSILAIFSLKRPILSKILLRQQPKATVSTSLGFSVPVLK